MARDEFACDDDAAALQVAAQVAEACSDVYTSYELWCGTSRIVPLYVARAGQAENEAARQSRIQEIVAEREQALLDSSWTVARSQKLLRAAGELMVEVAGAKGSSAG